MFPEKVTTGLFAAVSPADVMFVADELPNEISPFRAVVPALRPMPTSTTNLSPCAQVYEDSAAAFKT